MVRGINGQQHEEAEMMEQGYALNVLGQVRELIWDLYEEGRITHGCAWDLHYTESLLGLVLDGQIDGPARGRDEIHDQALDNIAERWAQGW